jgi:KipI family sensor histidine kinase inhibitor
MLAIEPLGDRAFVAEFETEDEAGRWARTVRTLGFEGVTDVVLAYQTVAVHADPAKADLDHLEARLQTIRPSESNARSGLLVEVPVLYNGPDLVEVADRLGFSRDSLIAQHSGVVYQVFAVGFLPGFPYAGYLPEALSGIPRRPEPRIRVPAGSVAIAGRQTGIYPSESPGGWSILGVTPLSLVDLEAERFLIRAGDRIRFRPISQDEFEAIRHVSS